jgi:RNA recognition motif-containing protein
MVPVRDIRQIKNKLTGKFKDFAFVEFFSPE